MKSNNAKRAEDPSQRRKRSGMLIVAGILICYAVLLVVGLILYGSSSNSRLMSFSKAESHRCSHPASETVAPSHYQVTGWPCLQRISETKAGIPTNQNHVGNTLEPEPTLKTPSESTD